MNVFYSSLAVLTLLVIGYGIFSFFRMQGLIREGRVLVRSSVPYQRTTTPEAPKVLFVGDSTGVGVGAPRPEESLAGRFGAEHPDWNVDNLSVSGRKTAEVLPVLKILGTEQYEQVVVQIGGNDITHFTDTVMLEADILAVLEEAKRVGRHVALLTCGNVASALLFPRPFAFLWERRTLLVRDIFMKAASKQGVTYVDLYRDKKTDPFFLEPYRYHASDLFHPSGEGYGLWYKVFKKSAAIKP